MSKSRVYELAKELRLSSKQLMKVLADLGITVKTHMSALADEEIVKVNDHLQKLQTEAAQEREDKKMTKNVTPQKSTRMAQAPSSGIQNRNTPSSTQNRYTPSGTETRYTPGGTETRNIPGGGTQTRNIPGGGTQTRNIPGGTETRNLPGGGTQTRNIQSGTETRNLPGGGTQTRNIQSGTETRNTPGGGTQTRNIPGGGTQTRNTPGGGTQTRNTPGGGTQTRNTPGGGTQTRNTARPNGGQAKPQARIFGGGKPGQSRPQQGKYKGGNRRGHGGRPNPAEPVRPQISEITIGETISVQELARQLARSHADVIKQLMKIGIMATINQEIDAETAALVALEFGAETKIEREIPITELVDLEDAPEEMFERSPVVTVMGHVDHGKTSLLDVIRKTKVTATEAGGITQHIGAYQVQVQQRRITFLDTPGHEAFTAMRARGAQATDIAVLVVAADDGVMPQTVEAINHAKDANVPIVVAINKIDKPNANPERVKQQLTEYGLVIEEWGGETIAVPVSAITGEGLDTLLDMILLVADLLDLRANPKRLARGYVIEAFLDKGRGPVATMLVRKGTLRIGDAVVAGVTSGRVRAMFDDTGKRIKQAGPSVPVEVLGLEGLADAGDVFQAVDEEKFAREVANQRQIVRRDVELHRDGKANLERLYEQMTAAKVAEVKLIIKADVHGSAEALNHALGQLNNDEVKINVIHSGVGAITETDVMFAAAADAIIVGFNVRPDANTRRASEKEQVDIRLYRIIYEVVDDIKRAMSGLLKPETHEVVLGRAEVRTVFRVPKAGVVAGSYVNEGKVSNRSKVRVIRDGVVIHEGVVDSLRRFKDDVREVAQGYECGIGIERFNDIKEGDVFESYIIEEKQRQM